MTYIFIWLHDFEIDKVNDINITKFTLPDNISNINKSIVSILHKHSISHEKLFGYESIMIRETVAPSWKI